MIIAFTAPAGSGKTTAARVLSEQVLAQVCSFSEPLKKLGEKIGLDVYGDKEKVDPTLGVSAREFLRTAGDALRNMPFSVDGHSYTTVCARIRIETLLNSGMVVIVDDLRYKEEYAALKDLGAIFVSISRASVQVDTSHSSETEMSGFATDYTLSNDGSLEDFKEQIYSLLKKLEKYI